MLTCPFQSYTLFNTVENLLANNNISQICYCGQISLQSAAVNCSFSNKLTPFGVASILLAMVHDENNQPTDVEPCVDQGSTFFFFQEKEFVLNQWQTQLWINYCKYELCNKFVCYWKLYCSGLLNK